MDSQDLVKAIKQLKPSAEFSFTDNDYSTIKWDVLDGDAPTIKELEEALKVVKAQELQAETEALNKKQEVLAKLGLTSDEVASLLA